MPNTARKASAALAREEARKAQKRKRCDHAFRPAELVTMPDGKSYPSQRCPNCDAHKLEANDA